MGSLIDAFLRHDRAAEHLEEFKGLLAAYVETNQETSLIKVEGNTVSAIWPPEPPPMFGIRAGEIVNHCRTALDYLVYQLAILDSGEVNMRTQFPIEDCPESFAARREPMRRGRPNHLTGVNACHCAAIEALQPYNGVDWTEFIRELSNEDKHRLIPLLGYQGSGRINVGGTEEEAKALGGFRRPGDMAMYFPAPFYVAFTTGTPVKEALEKVVSETRSVLEAFEPEFEGGHSPSPSTG